MSMNYYEILGVEPTAKLETIRDAYKKLALILHPDRKLINQALDNEEELGHGSSTSESASKSESGENDKGTSTSSSDSNAKAADDVAFSGAGSTTRESAERKSQININFYQIQDAWKTLSNNSRRFLYDMRTFGTSFEFPNCDESYLLDLEKAQAEKDISNMSGYLQKVVRRETRNKGVVIMDAWYGDISILSKMYLALNDGTDPSKPQGFSTNGEDALFIDVRVAAQCQVDYRSHRLIMTGGACTSRADLPGFYNPIPLSLRNKVDLGIFIRYQFNDEVHEVLANDTEPVYIPKKSHATSAIAQRLKKEDEHRAKFKKNNYSTSGSIGEKIVDPVTGNLILFTLFAGLLVYQERNSFKQLSLTFLTKQPMFETIGRVFQTVIGSARNLNNKGI